MPLYDLFTNQVDRPIETVIMAEDDRHLYDEVDQFVITKEVARHLAGFFEAYASDSTVKGAWISGFFGSGKSHLLKILSHILENKKVQGQDLGELFAEKVKDDEKLKADIQKCVRDIPSESLLFNIDQQAQITSKQDRMAVLQVFYKVFNDHRGFLGSTSHVANFEGYLFDEGKYEAFKTAFEQHRGLPWTSERGKYFTPQNEEALAKACAQIFGKSAEDYEDFLEDWEDNESQSVEDFAKRVKAYIDSKPAGFRLNFFIDEVGQFIADNTGLMLNLQSVTEALNTTCESRCWVMVTSQEDLRTAMGDGSLQQSNDFSKIQGRFKQRLPLSAANVDEVIEKRLLDKTDSAEVYLKEVFNAESENMKTLFRIGAEGGVKFAFFKNETDFASKYPFLPYQFSLFQQCISSLSKQNAFEGMHTSVGARSMLGVFQEVLKGAENMPDRGLASFDSMFEGLRGIIRSESKTLITLAEQNLQGQHPMAVRVLKALFLVKYFDGFKTTSKNVAVLLLDSIEADAASHHAEVKAALEELERQVYIQRKGEEYEFLTDKEKDVENAILEIPVDPGDESRKLAELIFDGLLPGGKMTYRTNGQVFEFGGKVDGLQHRREKSLMLEFFSAIGGQTEDQLKARTIADASHLIFMLPEDKLLLRDLRLHIQTEKYIRLNNTANQEDLVKRILLEKGSQNEARMQQIKERLNEAVSGAPHFLNGAKYEPTGGADPKVNVDNAFQNLIKVVYSKLTLLGAKLAKPEDWKSILRSGQAALVTEDSIGPAEEAVLNWLALSSQSHERATLKKAVDHFRKPSFGWPEDGILLTFAKLQKLGKIECERDANTLEDSGVLAAFENPPVWGNVKVKKQEAVDTVKLSKLRNLHQELFQQTNPHPEAKEAIGDFKTQCGLWSDVMRKLMEQKHRYPFLEKLAEVESLVRDMCAVPYRDVLERLDQIEEWTTFNEDWFTPIKQFMREDSEQRKIYDQAHKLIHSDAGNMNFIEVAQEKEEIKAVLDSEAPFRGRHLIGAKDMVESVRRKLIDAIRNERDGCKTAFEQVKHDVTGMSEFAQLSDADQQAIRSEVDAKLSDIEGERLIGNLRTWLNGAGATQTDLKNRVLQKTTPSNEEGQEPVVTFVSMGTLVSRVKAGHRQLKTPEEVEAYIEALRTALLAEVENNRHIENA